MTSQLNPNTEKLEARRTTLFDRTFRDSEGRIVIAQMPNLPVLVGLGAAFLQLVLPGGKIQTLAELVAFGALFTWAWQETFSGVNYFRRGLGLISLVSLLTLGLNLIQV
jgi:hypothetical protein